MAGRWMTGACLLAWLSLAGPALAQAPRYTYAYPYGWGGWKPSDEWVRRDAFGRPFYLGWRVNVTPYAPPQFTYRPLRHDSPEGLLVPDNCPPIAPGTVSPDYPPHRP